MNKTLMFEKLLDVGLNEDEARLYFHLLQNGNKTPLQISRETTINRSKAYRTLDDLKEKKLVEEKINFDKKTFQAAPPENLEIQIIEKEEKIKVQRNGLSDLVKNLNKIKNNLTEDFQIKNYRGEDGLKQMLWNEITSGTKEILILGYETRNELAGKKFAEKTRLEQIKRQIKCYELENAKDQGEYWYTDLKQWPDFYESRYIPKKILKIRQQTVIYKDTVAIFSWKEKKRIGTEIINKSYANMQKQIFWQFWEITENLK
ncbi:hypothetical protein GF362_01900 [Candidatus Dojkabacteria bacterium]|nr:hypothetical protein [Candidatus Dojkabacteria bacterium]